MHERRVEQTAGPGGRPRCAVGCTRVHAEHRSVGERTRAHVKCVPVSCVRQCSSTSSVETCPVRRVALGRGSLWERPALYEMMCAVWRHVVNGSVVVAYSRERSEGSCS